MEIGRIDLKNTFSFFEVPEGDADRVEASLRDVYDRNGRRIPVERASADSPLPRKKEGNKKHRSDSVQRADEGHAGYVSSRKHNGRKESERGSSRGDKHDARNKYSTSLKSDMPMNRDASGKKKYRKEDWMALMKVNEEDFDLKGEIPDFSENGWAKKKSKKKKK